MRISFLNLTEDNILFSFGPPARRQDAVALPSLPITVVLPKRCDKMRLTSMHDSAKKPSWTINPEGLLLRVSMAVSASWQPITVPPGCPWCVYSVRVSHRHHRLAVLPRRRLSSFLSGIPDAVPLSSLLLPGTHDTMAFYGWPISQCQSILTPLDVQLQSGIRVLDIRLALVKSRLVAYHGIYPQRTTFQEILSVIHAFLTSSSGCRETVVMSLKQEDFAVTRQAVFSKAVHEEIYTGPGGRDMWFFENRIPTLGEARGKVVLLSRFGGDGWDDGLGIHPTNWPDSAKYPFTWQCDDTLVRTSDWYRIPSFLSIPEKVALATSVLLPPPNNPPMPVLSISYFSAASFPLAAPSTIAQGFGWPKWGFGVEGVNSRLGKWMLDLLTADKADNMEKGARDREPRIRGWTFLDFYSEPEQALVPLMVELNFRGRRSGEEGW